MKVLLGLMALLLSLTSYGEPSVQLSPDVTASNATLVCSKDKVGKLLCKPLESGDIQLTTDNLIVLRGPIVAQTASKFVADFHKLEHRDEVQTIYVYVKSPGGSIFAGDYISNILSSSKKEVVVIVDFAASMAFHVSHFADKRLMVPTGTMMQHHASGGTGSGEFPNVEKQWDWIQRKVARMNVQDAKACLNTTHDQFMKNIDRDWWLLSEEALKAGCIDGIASTLTCSKDLTDKVVKEEYRIGRMKINLEWSGCPLESYPRKVKVRRQGDFSNLDPTQQIILDRFLMLLTDPLQYYSIRGGFDLDQYYDIEGPSKPLK